MKVTRRDFCRTAAGAAALSILPQVRGDMLGPVIQSYRSDKPLHQLQQEFLDLRFGMFLHFNMATFQDREWGDPTGAPSIFNPTALDTDGWAAAAKSAGMTYGCLTAKHHDGFAIWPTKTTFAAADVDVVKAFADSFRKAGLKVSLYYSILDLRQEIQHFNVTPAKIQLIKDQLTELLTNYGEINMLIFDGWDAPWSRIPYNEVPFQEIYALVKGLQPNCLISELNASEYPVSALYYTDIKAFEQNAGQHLPSDSSIPAQSCVTLTDGWFWKQKDVDAELKSVQQVVHEWLIPQNKRHCNLLLNAPPNRQGNLSPGIVKRLEEIGKAWTHPGQAEKIGPTVVITSPNLSSKRPIRASSSPDTLGPDLANDGNFQTSWCTDYGQESGYIEVELSPGTKFNTLALVEPVGKWKDYQESRIKSYKFERWNGTDWITMAEGGVPVQAQLHSIRVVAADRIRLLIQASRDTPHVAEIGVYYEPSR